MATEAVIDCFTGNQSMTVIKPKVEAYLHSNKENSDHRGVSLLHDASCTSTLTDTVPLIRLNDYEALHTEYVRLLDALEEIISPIPYMEKRLEEGERLNGTVAVQLAEDAEYLRDIAYKAVTTYRKQKGDL